MKRGVQVELTKEEGGRLHGDWVKLFESHGPKFLLKTSEKRLEAQPSVHVLDANGSNMSGALQAEGLHLNRTAAYGLQDEETSTALFGA